MTPRIGHNAGTATRGQRRGMWPRGRQWATVHLAWLTLVVLMFSLHDPLPAGAAPRSFRLSTDGLATVFIEPYTSQSLWFYSLDPAWAGGPPDNDALVKIYAGLVKQVYDHATGRFRITPDLAAGMPVVSQGGRVYTFTLRKDARFSDGSPVTAQDVVYSLNRALAPAEKSPIAAFYLTDILGSAAVASGKAKTCAGLEAIGTETVQITLDKPVAYFLYTLSYPVGLIVKHTLPVGAKLTTTPSLVIGAGPFMLKGATWRYRQQVTLVPNPYYYNARHIKLREIDLVFTGSTDAAFFAYRAGQFPMAPVPAAEVAAYRGRPEFHEVASLWDGYIGMNVKQFPFTNRHVRRAVAFAINRDAIANGVLRGTVKTLLGWYPRGLMGYDPTIRVQVPHYDPAMARRELALARTELRRNPGAIDLMGVSTVPDWVRMYEQIQRDLRAIGLAVTFHPVSDATYADVVQRGKAALFAATWLADYADPQDWSDGVLGTGGAWNWTNYSNRRVDALFAAADVERDPAMRERLYKQAQLIILNDAPVAMTHQMATQMVISSRYHGIELNPEWAFYPQPIDNDWANVTVSP